MNFDIRVANPLIDAEDIQSVVKALREGRLSSGVYAETFEKHFSKFIGVKHSISVNSATAALQLILASVGIKIGAFPVSEMCSKTSLCMPMFSSLSEKNQKIIVNHIKDALKD